MRLHADRHVTARNPRHKQALPPEFITLGLHFHQGLDRMVDTFEDLTTHLAGGFSDRERQALRAFLTDIVASASAEDLLRMWSKVSVDFRFADGEAVRRLLAAVRDDLGRGRTRPGWVPVGEGKNHVRRVPASKRR